MKDYFSNPALQVNYSNLRTSTPSQSLILCPKVLPILLVNQPALLASASQTTPFALVKNFLTPLETSIQRIHCLAVVVLLPKLFFLSNVNNFGFENDLINF